MSDPGWIQTLIVIGVVGGFLLFASNWIRNDIATFRKEIREDITSFRKEIRKDVSEARKEARADNKDVREDIQKVDRRLANLRGRVVGGGMAANTGSYRKTAPAPAGNRGAGHKRRKKT